MNQPASAIDMPRVAQWRARMRDSVYGMLHGLVPSTSAIVIAHSDEPINDAHFEEAVCRNCGKPRPEPHCGACGQKAVARLDLKDVWREFWQSWRLFEATTVKASLEMLLAPGRIAREYVLGARKRHVHPLKLLFFAVGLLLVVLSQTNYLESGQTQLAPLMKKVVSYSRWSFSLTLLAVFGASWIVFRRRLGYNAVEHLVLAVYTQFVIIGANLANLLPLLAWNTPHVVQQHRALAQWWMGPVELLIVGVAIVQFQRLKLPRDLVRLAIALALFYALKTALLFAYGRLIVQLVLRGA